MKMTTEDMKMLQIWQTDKGDVLWELQVILKKKTDKLEQK